MEQRAKTTGQKNDEDELGANSQNVLVTRKERWGDLEGGELSLPQYRATSPEPLRERNAIHDAGARATSPQNADAATPLRYVLQKRECSHTPLLHVVSIDGNC